MLTQWTGVQDREVLSGERHCGAPGASTGRCVELVEAWNQGQTAPKQIAMTSFGCAHRTLPGFLSVYNAAQTKHIPLMP